jgi:hypothetical protein
MLDERDLEVAVRTLARFISDAPLTTTIAELEHDLDGRRKDEVEAIIRARGFSSDLLRGAMLIRGRLGRINDLIHATAITLALSELMTPGEVLLRPSLAAGNDPSRPYDVETDRRVAEFKLSRWDGSDAMRKRQVFKDLVHLAADTSGRRAELYVLGTRPLHFLRETRSTAAWGLDRSPATQTLFEERFGRLDVPIRDFTNGPGSHVTILNLEEQLPDLFAPLSRRGCI